jgi:hypothetical protein
MATTKPAICRNPANAAAKPTAPEQNPLRDPDHVPFPDHRLEHTDCRGFDMGQY